MEQLKLVHEVFISFSCWYFFLLLVTVVGEKKKGLDYFFFLLLLFSDVLTSNRAMRARGLRLSDSSER